MFATGAVVSSNTVNSILRKNRSSTRLGNGRRSEAIDVLIARKKPYSDKAQPDLMDRLGLRYRALSLLECGGLDLAMDPYGSNSQG